MYTLLHVLLLTIFVCKSFANGLSADDNSPFWINSCGYSTNDDDSMIDRILILAKQCQINIDPFKVNYIKSTFSSDYLTHYERWVQENNGWISSRLLINAEDDLQQSWLSSRSFPSELKFTFELLQQVAVGFELLLEDAKAYDSLENKFLNYFVTCKNDLKQLLCEISDDIDITEQERPVDVERDAIPNGIRQESSTAKRNLTNSIIFRDYMIAIKYVTSTYSYFNNTNNVINNPTRV